MIESLRANIAGRELRTPYFASRQEFYRSYIDLLMRMQMQNPTAAFDSLALEVSERARARSLLELLTESRADLRLRFSARMTRALNLIAKFRLA